MIQKIFIATRADLFEQRKQEYLQAGYSIETSSCRSVTEDVLGKIERADAIDTVILQSALSRPLIAQRSFWALPLLGSAMPTPRRTRRRQRCQAGKKHSR